jgi:hypothetical protein
MAVRADTPKRNPTARPGVRQMNQDINRLLMELERLMRAVNREVINPQIKELSIDEMRPALCLVANARASYLKAFFELGAGAEGNEPTETQLDELTQLRHQYNELAEAAKALETAIQRGYIDVKAS